MLHRSYVDWNRAEQRRNKAANGVVYRASNIRVSVRVTDLSYGGCQIVTSHRLDADEQITLVIVEFGAEIPATVRWATEDRAGLSFVQ